MSRSILFILFLLSSSFLSAQGYFYTEGTVQINAGASIEIKGNSVIHQTINGDGYMVMNGDNPQTLGGNSAQMNNLKIVNNAQVSLTDPLWVNDTLAMSSGIIYLDEENVYLADNSVQTGNATGYVQTNGIGHIERKVDNNPFTFHTGWNAEYFPITITELGVTDTFQVQAWDLLAIDGTSSGTPIVNHVALLSYSFTDKVAGGNNLNISMQWNDSKNAVDFVQPYAVGIGYDGSNYIELDNCPTNVNSMDPNIVSYTGIINTGTFGIGDSIYLSNTPSAYITPGDTAFCDGNSVVYTAFPTGASAYTWNTSAITNSITADTTGIYWVEITDSTGCIYASESVSVTVYSLPLTPTITATDTVLSISASYTTYQWYLNGTPIAGANGPSYSISQNGNYSVVVSNSNGCTSASTDYNFNTFGIENEQITLNIFNQQDLLHIQLNGDEAQEIFIYDALGKVVYQQPFISNSISLQLSHGMYVVRVIGNTKEYVKKIIW